MEELICYCFNYTFSDIESDVKENGKSTIEERVASEKKAGSCQCETKNPKGRWCLGDVRRAVDTVMKKEGISRKVSIPFMQS
jgi:hypothetical protein